MKVGGALVVCSLGLAACGAHEPAVRTAWVPAYAFGAIDGGDLDVRDHCAPGTLRELSVGSSLATLGVSLATLGVYTPREVRMRCDAPR